MAKIILVEDEAKIARFVQLELVHEGYEVEVTKNGNDGLEAILKKDADLVVLDIMLPGMNGLEVCKKARQAGVDIPIIMLTAKDDIMDKVTGLDNGADDYMTKPFATAELLARIRVHLSRHQKLVDTIKEEEKPDKLVLEKLVVDRVKHVVYYADNEINLTKKEFDLLEYLMENIDVAVSRDTILDKVWEYDFYGNTNVVDVYVRYIRQKIDDVYNVNIIRTVRGIGYEIRSDIH